MNAHQIAKRLIDLGLAPVALLPPNHPSEAEKPPEKRGKAPFARDWQSQPAPRSVDDMPDLMPECNVGVRTGDWMRAMELHQFEIEVLKGGR
jgi:hypothetical protein